MYRLMVLKLYRDYTTAMRCIVLPCVRCTNLSVPHFSQTLSYCSQPFCSALYSTALYCLYHCVQPYPDVHHTNVPYHQSHPITHPHGDRPPRLPPPSPYCTVLYCTVLHTSHLYCPSPYLECHRPACVPPPQLLGAPHHAPRLPERTALRQPEQHRHGCGQRNKSRTAHREWKIGNGRYWSAWTDGASVMSRQGKESIGRSTW